MPRIFDNIEQHLLPSIRDTLKISQRADFCVGFFNLRGWKKIDDLIELFTGSEDNCCRLLVGMNKLPSEELAEALNITDGENLIGNKEKLIFKQKAAKQFRMQLSLGAPDNEDEVGLKNLAKQIRHKKVQIKLYLKHSLHAKLYLMYREDCNNPTTGYVGSSNLTLAGLLKQGELNVDVLEHDACYKLEKWFNDRWNENASIDISEELAEIIENSWAREELISPYHIYLKMAYHLAQDARAGLSEFKIPQIFQDKLFPFQQSAVSVAAKYLNKNEGVLLGDVVGLGKTFIATALAKIYYEDFGYKTLVICPKNLVDMWKDYLAEYEVLGDVKPVSLVTRVLPNLRPYKLVIIDESHNLRNRQGKRFRAIREYVEEVGSKCILLSATPYNKEYTDLSNQLRLFLDENKLLPIKPESYIRHLGSEIEFQKKHHGDILPNTLRAFEQSHIADDWRELMRMFLVRRTRSFIINNYASIDESIGRKFLSLPDGRKFYFPERIPKTLSFDLDVDTQYANLYSDEIVDLINSLCLPRYGLANHLINNPELTASRDEQIIIENLSRAGKRLIGFTRINLFKRLESSGFTFILSLDRHILRNYVFIHAIENDLPLPIGNQDVSTTEFFFDETDFEFEFLNEEDENDSDNCNTLSFGLHNYSTEWYKEKSKEIYNLFSRKYASRFDWINPKLFQQTLKQSLLDDSNSLINILTKYGFWDSSRDSKLTQLHKLMNSVHPEDKLLIFSQYSDSIYYLKKELKNLGIEKLDAVTGDNDNPTHIAYRFSPKSNNKNIPVENEIRILLSTDVLSEGQNLQDCYIIVNYDLPWAIIKLIQRAGRVDRIGQTHSNILCYSFLSADGVNRIIRLRERVSRRLNQNAEVVGTDEKFFGDEIDSKTIHDLYTEKSGVLNDADDEDIDLGSYALQIWLNATKDNTQLRNEVENLENVVFSSKDHLASEKQPEGVLLYTKTQNDNDSLIWIDKNGNTVSQSPLEILKAASCGPVEKAFPRKEIHHDLVRKGLKIISKDEQSIGGQLGKPSGAKFRTYQRLKKYYEEEKSKNTLFGLDELNKSIEDIYKYPLREGAKDILNRQLKTGIDDYELAELVMNLRKENRLSIIPEDEEDLRRIEPQIICSLGLFNHDS